MKLAFYRSEGIHVLEIHVIAVKLEPPLVSKNNETTYTRNDRIKIARAHCTAVILFDPTSD